MIPIFCCKVISTSRKTLCFLFLHIAWQYRCKTVVDSVSHGIQEMSEILIGQDLGESEKQKAYTLILWKSTWLKLEQGSLLLRCVHQSSFSKTRLSGVQGVRSVSPPQSISTAKTLAAPPPTPTVTSFSFPAQRRSVSLCACVPSALLIRREAQFMSNTNCVLNPTNRLEWYRDAWVVL